MTKPTTIWIAFLTLLFVSHSVRSHYDKHGDAKALVDANWLSLELQKNPDMIVVDVRETELYALGHIPGAVNIPVERSFNQRQPNRIATLSEFREVLSAAGILNSNYIIIYDNGMLTDAAHMFWVLETYGHRMVSVLNGGLPAWVAQGGRLSEQNEVPRRSQYIPSLSPHHISTKLTTRLAMENNEIMILDARAESEYMGLKSSASRKGHIPGAVNIPAINNIEQSGQSPMLKSDKEIQSIYSALGKPKGVITYCNRGKEAAMSYLVLRNLGISVSVYDGAWPEWAEDNHMPIVNPSK